MNDLKKRGLGKGLSALMPTDARPTAPSPVASTAPPVNPPSPTTPAPRVYFHADIETISPQPGQPRRLFSDTELDELAASIRTHGVIMPLIVRAKGQGYQLIAGERRWRAAQRAGLPRVPVVVQDVDDRAAFERAIVENVQRQDLSPLEEAAAYQRLADAYGLSHEQIGERVGKDRATISNTLRLLKLPPTVRAMVDAQQLSMGHARALLALESPAQIETGAREVIDRGLSVRATEAWVRTRGAAAATSPRSEKPAKSAAIRDLEQRLTRSLGGPVELDEDAPGKGGALRIRYLDLDHLDRLLERLL